MTLPPASPCPSTDDVREKLEAYERLFVDRAIPLGMIARGDATALRARHIVDALRAEPLLPAGGGLVDLGSGAGIPGSPSRSPARISRVTLAEPRRKRAAFLELVLDEIELPGVHVHIGRAEDAPRAFDIGVARAFAPLRRTWEVADRLLAADGALLYWAGARDLRPDLPTGTAVRTFTTSTLAETGAIVIMTRQ